MENVDSPNDETGTLTQLLNEEGDCLMLDAFDGISSRASPDRPPTRPQEERDITNLPERQDPTVMDVLKDVPKFVWSQSQKKFTRVSGHPTMFPEVSTFINILAGRYQPVIERLKRVSSLTWWDETVDPSLTFLGTAPRATSADSGREVADSGAEQENEISGSSGGDENMNSSQQTLKRRQKAPVPPWHSSRAIIWPVECAIGRNEHLTLVGILQKRRDDGEDCLNAATATTATMITSSAVGIPWDSSGWYLTDMHQWLRIDVSNAALEDAYFVEGMVVIAEGRMTSPEKVFVVHSMYQPPRESGDDVLYPVEMWGGNITKNAKTLRTESHQREISQRSKASSTQQPAETWIVFSEVNLDEDTTKERLRRELTVVDSVVHGWYSAAAEMDLRGCADDRDTTAASLGNSMPISNSSNSEQQRRMSASTTLPTIPEDTDCPTPTGHHGGRRSTAAHTPPQIFGGASSSSLVESDYRHTSSMTVVSDPPQLLTSSASLQLPVGIVFLGNFMSFENGTSFNFTMAQKYSDCFRCMTEILLEMPNILKYCHLVFVPGPRDPGPCLLPKPPIPPLLTQGMQMIIKEKYPKASITLASNPCRIRYKSRELVFFRHDLVQSLAAGETALQIPMCQKYSPSEEELAQHVPHLIASQGHLCPISAKDPQNCVAWDFDYTLRIDPLPDLVCVADSCDPYVRRLPMCGDTIFFNPGASVTEKAVYNVNSHDVTIMETDM